MYLAPHHFQAQAVFFENSLQFLNESLHRFGYGFTGLEIDEQDLKHGAFRIHHARGLMPDGTAFDESSPDTLPPALNVADIFPATGQPLKLYLALVERREGYPAVGELPGARYRRNRVHLQDWNTGQDSRPVDLMSPNFRVLPESALTDDDVTLPIAQVVLDGKGQYLLHSEFVPPCVRLEAARRLEAIVDRLLEVLTAKSATLTQRRRAGAGSDIRWDRSEQVEFWLLNAINSAIPILRMRRRGRSPHPAEIFNELSALAGALCTFVPNSTPASFPEYDHLALGSCFRQVADHIERHLDTGNSDTCIAVHLQPFAPGATERPEIAAAAEGSNFLWAAVDDPRFFSASEWILSVKAKGAETTLMTNGPALIRASSRELIARVVAQGVSGIPLSYLPVPPCPSPFGEIHFSIDRKDRLFEAVNKFRTIGISFPAVEALAGAEFRLQVFLGKPR